MVSSTLDKDLGLTGGSVLVDVPEGAVRESYIELRKRCDVDKEVESEDTSSGNLMAVSETVNGKQLMVDLLGPPMINTFYRTHYFSQVLHNALNTIYLLTTAFSSSPTYPHPTNQSLHPSSGRFTGYSSKFCTDFIASPSEDTLFAFLAIPKLGLQLAAHLLPQGQRLATDHLDSFLNAPWPKPDHRPTSQGSRVSSIGRLVTQGPPWHVQTWSGETPRFWT